jgi:hypothetical protein
VPRTWDALVTRYGLARATRTGRLPYRAEELFDRLVGQFRDLGKPSPPAYVVDDICYFAAVLSHYVEDAHQPLHVTSNYDGRATNQTGLHSRFETELVLRQDAQLRLTPIAIRPIPDFNTFIFDVIVKSQSMVDAVLGADRVAASGRELYDGPFFDAFFRNVRPTLEDRLGESASAVASVIVAAWQRAGSPTPPPDGPRPPVRIR